MNTRARRKAHLLRTSRRGPWGKNFTKRLVPYTDEQGREMSELVRHPDYVRRNVLFTRRKARAEAAKIRLRELDHALSDCCGWGNTESHYKDGGGLYPFVSGSVPPRPKHLPYPEDEDNCVRIKREVDAAIARYHGHSAATGTPKENL